MNRPIQLSTFQIGAPRKPGEGFRIAVTRRPQRGVRKEDWNSVGCFDVWFPTLAPSPDLVARLLGSEADATATREKLFRLYEKELAATAEARQTVALIAEIAARIPVSIGCFCADESRCHRSRLYKVILNFAE